MERRPPNPRRLSRSLFNKPKPTINPAFDLASNVPKFAVGDVEQSPALRSDLDSILVRPGEDFISYEQFKYGIRTGRIKGFSEKKESYKLFRKDILDRSEYRVRLPADEFEERDNSSDTYYNAPFLKFETKGMTPDEKKALFKKDRDKVIANAAFNEVDIPYSMNSENRKEAATKLSQSIEGMTRSQQRKLGRVIRDGKTGPLTRTRKDPYEEEELRNVYEETEYEPVRYDIPKNEGVLKYSYGRELADTTDVKGERLKLKGEYEVLRKQMAVVETKYHSIRNENSSIIKNIDKKKQLKGYGEDARAYNFYTEGGDVRDDWGQKPQNEIASANEGRITSAFELKDNLDKGKPSMYHDDEDYTGDMIKNRLLYDKRNRQIPAALNVLLNPEQRKLLERNAKTNKGLKKDYVKLFDEMKKVKDEYKDFADLDNVRPKRETISVERKFTTPEGFSKAVEEMKEKTKGKGLYRTGKREYTPAYEDEATTYKKGDANFDRLMEKAKQKPRDPNRRNIGTTPKIKPTATEKYEVLGNMDDVMMTTDDVFGGEKRAEKHPYRSGYYKNVTHRKEIWTTTGVKVIPTAPRFFGDEGAGIVGEGKLSRVKGRKRDWGKDFVGKNPLEEIKEEEDVNAFLDKEGLLKFNYGDSKTAYNRKLPIPDKKVKGVPFYENANGHKVLKREHPVHGWDDSVMLEKIPIDEDRGIISYEKKKSGRGYYTGNPFVINEEVVEKGVKYKDEFLGKFYINKDGKVVKRSFKGKKKRPIRKVKRVKRLGVDMMGNPDFVMRVANGKGKRIFHLEEAKEKGWREVEVGKYNKQKIAWKALDVDTTPKDQLQLRGLRDRRTGRGRLIGRGRLDPRRVDRSREYKSARNEALIQMRINETAGVRDAKSKADKEIKNIRISEAQKALNLKLQKETAEKTAEGIKKKNAGLVHSYNVNIRNQTAATLLGSDPEELNKILKKGGGLALVKTMIRKGEISDASTIGQLTISSKQKENMLRLLNEGGTFVEGQEYFYRTLDDFGRTIVQRGYLNKGGERKDNLELMKITTNDDGTSTTQRFIVPKGQILAPDDYTTTTTSGKKQQKVPDAISDFELDLYTADAPPPKKAAVKQDPKTGVKSLVQSKGGELDDPSPREKSSIFGIEEDDFDTMGGDLSIGGLDELPFSSSSDEGETFEFGGNAPTEPEPQSAEGTPYGIKPVSEDGEFGLDDALDLADGTADDIANVMGGGNYKLLGSPRLGEAVDKLRSALKKKPVEEEEEEEERPPTPPPKKISIADEIAATFSPEQSTIGGVKTPTNIPMDWRGSKTNVPDVVLKENWDLRAKGLKTRLDEGGSQEVPEGYVAIWTTKHADKSNQTALVVNESDIYYLVRGLRKVGIRNDKGVSRPITDASLKAFYRKSLEAIRDGKKLVPFNDKQLLRGFDMIDAYESETEESEDED